MSSRSSSASIYYNDFSRLRMILPTLRVDELKAVLRDINQNSSINRSFYAKVSGRKDDLIQRIEGYLQDAISQNASKNYESIRSSVYRHSREIFTPFASSSSPSSTHNPSGPNRASYSSSSASSYRPSSSAAPGTHRPNQSGEPHHRALAPTYDFGSTPLAPSTNTDPYPVKLDPVFGTHSKPGNLRSPFLVGPRASGPENQKLSTPNQARSSNGAIPPLNQHSRNQQMLNANHPVGSRSGLPPGQPAAYGLPSNANNPLLRSFSVLEPQVIPIPFEKSPFYRIDSSASTVVMCPVYHPPPQASTAERKTICITITINSEQRQKLSQPANPTGSQFQLRLFSTSENFFTHPSYAPPLPVQPPAPTEFPATNEVNLNNQTMTVNLRGIKKQPGTAPPPDLSLIPGKGGVGKALDLREGASNRLELGYSSSDRKFYCVIYLVEYFSINSILKNLKANLHRTDEQVLGEIKGGSEDDDVITSSSVLSLNDPVVMSRIRTPIRSMKCSHLQCFDAEMFYMMMETTPTWLCPVCNVKLRNEDITIDDYFATILKEVPSSVNSVIVESDGTWHDESYKYGNCKAKPNSRSVFSVDSGSGSSPGMNERRDLISNNGEGNGSSKKRSITVLELESDDDDEDDEEEEDDDDEEDEEGEVDDENENDEEYQEGGNDGVEGEGGGGGLEERKIKKRKKSKRRKKCVRTPEPIIIDLTLDDD